MDIFQCLDDCSHIVEGIYTDKVFSYYTFIVSSKEDSQENFDRINNYLMQNDCKLNVYYTDITFDLNNYKNVSRRYLDSIFIQLDPNYVKKMNAYFLNQYLYDDDYLIWVFNDDENFKVETKFSRTEDYSLYKGMDRFQSGLDDYQHYAKLYIRAETKKTEIIRKYQKFIEYFADASSLLIAIYRILVIIFENINNFYADISIKKKIFIFKDFEFSHLNKSNQLNQIKELIYITDETKDKNKNFSKIVSKNMKENTKKINPIGVESGTNILLNNENIRIYSKRKKLSKKGTNFNLIKEKDNLKSINDESPNIMITNRRKNNKINYSLKKSKYNNGIKNNNFSNEGNNLYEKNGKGKTAQECQLENEKIEYSFNLFDIIGTSFCKCCLSKKLSFKNNLNEKANKLLFHKLDIALYVQNMLLIDIINQLILEDNMKNIINFISRPIFSSNLNKEKEFESFYQTYTNKDFDKLYDELYEFSKKDDKKLMEEKILNISNKQLKELI